MRTHFREDQIYRIDHYLGKETVQNILVFRFANTLFEPLWNHNFIDHVQITVGETVPVGSRGDYYDKSGVLRDMFQNHLLQLLAVVAMEAPARFAADPLRNEKIKVLDAVPAYTRGRRGGEPRHRTVRRLPLRERRRSGQSHADVRRRASCRSTTGAGRACRSSCAPARRWRTGPARS